MKEQLIGLAKHILAMQDDAYLACHPEWNEIVREAAEALSPKQEPASNIHPIFTEIFNQFLYPKK